MRNLLNCGLMGTGVKVKVCCRKYHICNGIANTELYGKTEDHHLTGIALSDTNKRYTVGKVSPNALHHLTQLLAERLA